MVNEINRKIAELRGGAVDIGKVHTLRTDIDSAQYPDYEHDLNEAFTLLKEMNAGIVFDTDNKQWEVSVWGKSDLLFYVLDDNAAQAICEAWLQWKGVK